MKLLPILIQRFRVSQHSAHGTSLAVIGASAIFSLLVYGMHSSVAWGMALRVAIASVITVRLGTALARRMSSSSLARAFAIFLVAVALRLLWRPPAAEAIALHGPAASIAIELGLGGAIGLVAGVMGVGGGVIAVPAFTMLLGMSQRMAQGTSLAVILATAPVGTFENSRHNLVAWRLVPLLAIGAAAGGPVASWFAHLVPQVLLARIFASFMLFSAWMLWRRAPAPRPAPG